MIGSMKKTRAIKILGGSGAAAARSLNISRQAVHKWPDPVSRKVEAKVAAFVEARKQSKAVTQ